MIPSGLTRSRLAPCRGGALIFVMCLVQVLGLMGLGAFPALLPTFVGEWKLSNTEAGWLSGIFFAGYLLSVPVLVTLTDRVDARRIFLFGAGLTAFSGFAFAFLAEGFWTALALRFVSGIGLAGAYMPGLKALTDRLEGGEVSRAVAFYTASWGVGGALSVYLAGEVAAWRNWHWAFALAALGSVAAFLLVALALRPKKQKNLRPDTRLLDFRPVLANRRVVGYVISYAWHNWEIFGLASWVVAFLTFAAAGHAEAAGGFWKPTVIGAMVTLVALPASVLGNEISLKFGRKPTVVTVMVLSAGVGAVVGFTALLPYWIVAAMVVLYGVTTAADSSSITAGAIGEAAPELRGATMAVHSCVGFVGAFAGPLVMGAVLDLAGGEQEVMAWGLAFAVCGSAGIAGAIMLPMFERRRSP